MSNLLQCPHCGQALELTVTAGGSFSRSGGRPATVGGSFPNFERRGDIQRRIARRPYALGAVAGTFDEWDELRFEQPTRPASREADVVVPLLQALVSGAFAGVVVTGAAAGLAWRLAWPVGFVPLAGLLAGVGVTWQRWELLLDDSRGLLRKVEEFIKRGDDGAGVALAPQVQIEVQHVDANGGGVRRIEYDRLPVDVETLRHVFTAYMGGRCQLSRRGLSDLPSIGKDRARDILAALEEAGYIGYPNGRNHPDGAELTSKGRAVAKSL